MDPLEVAASLASFFSSSICCFAIASDSVSICCLACSVARVAFCCCSSFCAAFSLASPACVSASLACVCTLIWRCKPSCCFSSISSFFSSPVAPGSFLLISVRRCWSRTKAIWRCTPLSCAFSGFRMAL